MSHRTYRVSSRDANEREIVEAFQKCGARVWRMEPPCPFDLLVEKYGQHAVEVKTEDGRFTDLQKLFARSFTLEVAWAIGDVPDLIAKWGKWGPSAIYSKDCR